MNVGTNTEVTRHDVSDEIEESNLEPVRYRPNPASRGVEQGVQYSEEDLILPDSGYQVHLYVHLHQVLIKLATRLKPTQLYTRIQTLLFTRIQTQPCTRIQILLFTRIQTEPYTRIQILLFTRIQAQPYTRIQILLLTRIQTQPYTRIQILLFTRIQTQPYTRIQFPTLYQD